MTSRILDLLGHPLVVRADEGADDPEPKWAAVPFDIQAATAATALTVADPCTQTSRLIAGTHNASPKVYKVSAFAGAVSARRNVRCALGYELELVTQLLAQGGTTSALESALWNGVPGWDPNLAPSLSNTDVQTVAAATSIQDTLAAVVGAYSALTAMQEYIVHLGVKSALDLSALGYAYHADERGNLAIRATGAPVVVSPYYPTAGVALTGPLDIYLGGISAFQAWDSLKNRTNIVGDRILAIAFDPSTAVRAV